MNNHVWKGQTDKFLSGSRFDAALQEAAQVDRLIEEETGGEEVLEDRLPLLGVPLSVKSSYAFQGTVQTYLSHSKKIIAKSQLYSGFNLFIL